MDSGITKGTRVWLALKDSEFVGAEVLQIENEEHVLIQVDGQEPQQVKPSQLEVRNPRHLEETDDLTQLSYLNIPSILYNLKQRYARQIIYTYSGSILIAINPFQKLPIYSREMILAHKGQPLGNLAPHVFAIADNAYSSMLREERSQSILVSGESGAGKTETTKYLLQYFAEMKKSNPDSIPQLLSSPRDSPHTPQKDMLKTIEKKVLQSTPLLEAFGNAKTQRNDNSSRFGKFIDVKFHPQSGSIIGALLRTYLLEKSRVVSQIEKERNYHIFYQLLAGSSVTDLQKWKLECPESYQYLNQTGCIEIPEVNDAKFFEQTKYAMNTIGIDDAQQSVVFSLLAGILHLGNLTFEEVKNKTDASKISNEYLLPIISQLLSVDEKGLKHALLTREMVAVSDKYTVPLTPAQASSARDALAMTVYSKLFDWLVAKINESLATNQSKTTSSLSIAILDISGFESFDINGFEQFCINYANEKLQQQFNHHVFKLEQQEYIQEKIDWSVIEFIDNQDTLDLIEKKNSMCILELLDEESKLPKSTEATFAGKLYQKHLSNKHFSKPRFLPNGFTISHYAGDVTYDSSNFIEKNRDFVVAELIALLEKSSLPFVRDLLKQEREPLQQPSSSKKGQVPKNTASTSRFKFVSVSSQFRESLNQLMSDIFQTSPHYVRCIRPNSLAVPKEFVNDKVLHQLKCGGVMEAIRIKKQGFPARPTFEHFCSRYSILCPLSQKSDIKEKCKAILQVGKIDPSKYLMGLTKIFFRTGQLELLEKYRMIKIHQSATVFQKYTRRWLQIRRYKTLKKAAITLECACRKRLAIKEMWKLKREKAGKLLQRVLRGWVYRKKYLKFRQATLCLQSEIRLHLSKKTFKNLNEFKAVIRLQAIIRSFHIKNEFSMKKKSITIFQCSIRKFYAEKKITDLRIQARSIAKVQEEKLRLEQEFKELEKRIQEEQKQKELFRETEKELSEKMQVLTSQQRTLEETLTLSENRVKELEIELNQVKEEKNALKSELSLKIEEEKEQKSKLEGTVHLISQQLADLRQVVHQQESQMNFLEETKNTLEKQNLLLERNLDSLKEQMEIEKKEFSQRLQNEKTEKEKTQEMLESVKLKLTESKAQCVKLDETVSQLQHQNDELKLKIDLLEAKITSLLSAHNLTQKEMEEKQLENEETQQKRFDEMRQQLKAQLEAWKKKAKATETELELIQLDRDGLKDKKMDLESKIEQLKRKISDLEKTNMSKLNEQLQEKYDLEEQMNQLNGKLRESEDKGRKLQAKLLTLTSSHEEWKQKAEEAETLLFQTQQEKEKLQIEKNYQIQQLENQLKTEIEEAKSKLEQATTDFQNQFEALQSQIQQLQSESHLLQSTKQELSEKLTQTENNLQEYQQINKQLEIEKQELINQLEEAKAKSSQTQTYLEQLELKFNQETLSNEKFVKELQQELSKEREKLENLSQNKLNLENQSRSVENQLKQEKEKLEKQVKDLQAKLESEIKEKNQTEETKNQEIQKLQQLLSQEKETNTNLEKHVSQIRRKMNLLVLDPQLSEKLKKEEPEFAKAIVFQFPLLMETKFVSVVPSPTYVAFLYLQYCKIVETDDAIFIKHYLDSISKIIFTNLNNDQVLVYWLSSVSSLFYLVGKENSWNEPVEFPVDEGEPTEQLKRLYIRPESSAQLMLGLIEFLITIYHRLYKKIVFAVDSFILPAISEKHQYSLQSKTPSPVDQIYKILHPYFKLFREHLLTPNLVSHFFSQVFLFIQAKIFNAFLLRTDLWNVERVLHIKLNLKTLETQCLAEGHQWIGKFEDHFSKLNQAFELLMNPKIEISKEKFPGLNATQIKQVLIRAARDEYASPIDDKIFAKLESQIQPNETLLLPSIHLAPLKIEKMHYVDADDILSLPLPNYFPEKFHFTFFEKKFQSLINTARK